MTVDEITAALNQVLDENERLKADLRLAFECLAMQYRQILRVESHFRTIRNTAERAARGEE